MIDKLHREVAAGKVSQEVIAEFSEFVASYEKFIANSDYKWVPSHYITPVAYPFLANPKQFKLFRMISGDDMIPEIALASVVKRGININVSNSAVTIDDINKAFAYSKHELRSRDTSAWTTGVVFPNTTYLDYKKLFKEFDTQYFVEKFNRPCDAQFIKMVQATTLPTIYHSEVGIVTLINGELQWIE